MAKETKKNKTTKADFEYFESECRRWLDLWGLRAWRTTFVVEPNPGNFASVAWNLAAKNARFIFADDWVDVPVTRPDISRTAFHEACELLLAEYTDMARQWVCDDEIERVSHGIIRTLENVVWEKEYQRSF